MRHLSRALLATTMAVVVGFFAAAADRSPRAATVSDEVASTPVQAAAAAATLPDAASEVADPLPLPIGASIEGGWFGSHGANALCLFATGVLVGALLTASGGTAGILAVLIAPKAAAACVAATVL